MSGARGAHRGLRWHGAISHASGRSVPSLHPLPKTQPLARTQEPPTLDSVSARNEPNRGLRRRADLFELASPAPARTRPTRTEQPSAPKAMSGARGAHRWLRLFARIGGGALGSGNGQYECCGYARHEDAVPDRTTAGHYSRRTRRALVLESHASGDGATTPDGGASRNTSAALRRNALQPGALRAAGLGRRRANLGGRSLSPRRNRPRHRTTRHIPREGHAVRRLADY